MKRFLIIIFLYYYRIHLGGDLGAASETFDDFQLRTFLHNQYSRESRVGKMSDEEFNNQGNNSNKNEEKKVS